MPKGQEILYNLVISSDMIFWAPKGYVFIGFVKKKLKPKT